MIPWYHSLDIFPVLGGANKGLRRTSSATSKATVDASVGTFADIGKKNKSNP
jgi:hypothetical protein